MIYSCPSAWDELPQNHCGDDREGTLFSWWHIVSTMSTSFNHGLSLGAKIAYQHILLFSNLMFIFLLLWRCSVITFPFTQGLLRDICSKNAEILGLGKLSSALNPSGLSVFNSCIHISLRLFNLNVSISLSTQSLSNSV